MTAVPVPPEPQPEDMPEPVDMTDPANVVAYWAWKARLDRRAPEVKEAARSSRSPARAWYVRSRNLREDLPGGDL